MQLGRGLARDGGIEIGLVDEVKAPIPPAYTFQKRLALPGSEYFPRGSA